MSNQKIFCPGGIASQTGAAVKARYPQATIETCGKIPDVPPLLETNNGPFTIPIWNSHEGEVKAAEYVWNHIEKSRIKISDLWAKQIEFWLVRKSGNPTAFKKIGSVGVAKTQCSGFLAQVGAELMPCALTTVAFDEYRKGASWDGVLIAPGQGEIEAGYEIVQRSTANPNNFTSFVTFVGPNGGIGDGPHKSVLTGVTMRAFGVSLGDVEQTFFVQLLSSVRSIKDLPRLIFVLKRTAKVGLLFEGIDLRAADLLDAEELESGSIAIYEDAGRMTELYTTELSRIFSSTFRDLHSTDFIFHRGVSTCLFACPPLGLYTHGFEVGTVEPVVRFYISNLFALWDSRELKCDPTEEAFFQRHVDQWRAAGTAFIQFKTVNPTSCN